ncbi:hypothetical protein SAMD00019534_073730 [Acytostelium subglobosum LB1]|uniref:hypothetical protein n=1 Tax=Acytostelium subglobosum LB1 TaxID=1410327 RepID=UPI0006448017|nr:hypothetical protein SAMD00019534_073730 [Acytostelium subglobosum LB1]GAM24198.1 hypothetical protein SAMD00019534_073730 [Acytostelium subglobosum LB1]|eukprot:XP_012752524.1 hypothetical protein SAMD00019534_073730 [Acytostelium subglobosum LB1]
MLLCFADPELCTDTITALSLQCTVSLAELVDIVRIHPRLTSLGIGSLFPLSHYDGQSRRMSQWFDDDHDEDSVQLARQLKQYLCNSSMTELSLLSTPVPTTKYRCNFCSRRFQPPEITDASFEESYHFSNIWNDILWTMFDQTPNTGIRHLEMDQSLYTLVDREFYDLLRQSMHSLCFIALHGVRDSELQSLARLIGHSTNTNLRS